MPVRPMPKLFTYSVINGEPTPSATTLHPRWNDSGDAAIFGTDRFNFGALPSGRRGNGGYGLIGNDGFFWCSNEFISFPAFSYARDSLYNDSAFYDDTTNKYKGNPVRAVRTATTAEQLLPDGLISATYTDYDGNVYNCTKIGLQVWTTSNLKVTHYTDGTLIPTNLSDAAWAADTTGAMAVYGKNDGAYIPTDELTTEALMVDAYGRLYNWYAVNNASGLINTTTGFHVPADADFTQFTDYLIGIYPDITSDNVGDVLKSVRQVNSPYLFEGITYLTTDPKGWDEQGVSFSRTGDFGLNAEFTVPFGFAKEGRSLLKSIFDINGQFSNAKVRIYKRADNWALVNFYEYKLDFKTYKDDLEYVTIEGLETGLNSKFQVNSDTEYEIPLPEAKNFLNYTAASTIQQNYIQGLVGTMYNCGAFSNVYGTKRVSRINGNRAISAYSTTLGFVDGADIPFTGMIFKNKSVTTITSLPIKFRVSCVVKSCYLIGLPPTGFFVLAKHTADFSDPFTPIQEIGVLVGGLPDGYKTTLNVGSWREDTFETPELTATISLLAGEYVSLLYIHENGSYTVYPIVSDAQNTYIKLEALTAGLTDTKLCVVTHQWLIQQLLLKIDSSSTLVYNLLHTNIIPLLSCQHAIQNIGAIVFDGKVKATLKNVLKSLYQVGGIGEVLPKGGIGIDITGEIFTIDYLDKFYLQDVVPNDNLMATLNAINVQSEFDEKHCYNKIKVGSKATNLVDNGLLSFNCENNFSLPTSLSDKELDLVSPFVQDMYSIDKIIKDRQPILVNSTTKTTENDSKLVMFAGSSQGINYSLSSILGNAVITNPEVIPPNTDVLGSKSPTTGTYPNIIFPADTPTEFIFDNASLFNFNPQIGTYRLLIDIEISFLSNTEVLRAVEFIVSHMSPNYITFKNVVTDIETITDTTYAKLFDGEFECKFTGTNILFFLKLGYILGDINISKLNVSLQLIGGTTFNLYQTVPVISGFNGDIDTAYNIPFSPKRILNSFKNYIGISNWKSGATIDFISTDINSTLECQLGYEDAVVKESESLATIDADIVFQPISIIFDTEITFQNLTDLKTDKYRYYEVVEKGTSFKGWVNTAAFNIGENQKQQWKLQCKSIEKWYPVPGMVAFCAPADFSRYAQPVDIVDVYQKYDNPDKRYIFTLRDTVDKFALTQGTSVVHGYELNGVSHVDNYNVVKTTTNGIISAGNYTEVLINDTTNLASSGIIRINHFSETWTEFIYTSKTPTSVIGISQALPNISDGQNVNSIINLVGTKKWMIVCGDIYDYQFSRPNISIMADVFGAISNIIAASNCYEWLYCGKDVEEVMCGNSAYGYGSVKYIHLENETQLKKINYCAFYGVPLTGELVIPDSITQIGHHALPYTEGWGADGYWYWVGFNAGYLTKVIIGKNVNLIVDTFNSRNTIQRFDCYPLIAPETSASVLTPFAYHVIPELHIKPLATGYDVYPWNDTSIFSEIITDL